MYSIQYTLDYKTHQLTNVRNLLIRGNLKSYIINCLNAIELNKWKNGGHLCLNKEIVNRKSLSCIKDGKWWQMIKSKTRGQRWLKLEDFRLAFTDKWWFFAKRMDVSSLFWKLQPISWLQQGEPSLLIPSRHSRGHAESN